jgi:predicted O-methyltransferase YrrM
MEIIHADIVEYLLNVTPERDQVLQEMEQLALERSFPIIGPLVGRMLYVLARAIQAKRVLELGSGFGYSAYWLANAIGKDGIVICTDGNQQNADRAQEYFHRGRVVARIQYLVGDALKIIDTLDGPFDIIFNDIEKFQYPKVFRKAVPKLRKGGLLISDNVLWDGKVLDRKPDADTAGVLTYNRLIYSSKELFTTILPLRDGIAISIKL